MRMFFPFASAPKGASFNLICKSLSSIPVHHSNPSSHPTDYNDMFVPAPHSSDQESVSIRDTLCTFTRHCGTFHWGHPGPHSKTH